MPKTAMSTQQFAGLTDEEIDELLAHPHWESLGEDLDRLMFLIPPERPQCERTTVLTWIYQQQGVMSFLELSDRIVGFKNISLRKKHIRGVLRGLDKLLLVNIVNFPGDQEGELPDEENVIGRSSLISLTWTGMVWLRRAWQARARLGDERSIARVHQMLVEEEDDGKANEPYWVENITAAHPEGATQRAVRIADAVPAITSIFNMAVKKRR